MKLFASILIVLGCMFLGLAMEASDYVNSPNLSMYRGMGGSALVILGSIILCVKCWAVKPWQ